MYKSRLSYTRKTHAGFDIYGERYSGYDRVSEYAVVFNGVFVKRFNKQKEAIGFINNLNPAQIINFLVIARDARKYLADHKEACKDVCKYYNDNEQSIHSHNEDIEEAASFIEFQRVINRSKNIFEII